MKIGILGTGVIGLLYGWALNQKHEVLHIVRTEKLAELDEHKISIDVIDERVKGEDQTIFDTYKIHALPQADETLDLIIVPVAEKQLEQALLDLTS